MAFDRQFLDELQGRTRLSDLVGRKVKLIRRGREFVGLCPFHNEKTPSFTLNDDKGFYHCFGCGAHGSAIDFVTETEGLGFREAVERLTGAVGMELPRGEPVDRERQERIGTLREVMREAAGWFAEQLRQSSGAPGLDYLRERGLTGETIGTFLLGYAPDGRHRLRDALAARGISIDLMVEGGLSIAPEDGDEPFDRFRGRVMFPICDRRGGVVGFGGRALNPAAKAKYLNSPETPLFHKGRMLYAQHLARQSAHESGDVVATEGYMDVIALHQAGLRNVVAPLGTALTEEQLAEIWRMADEPTLCFDGDAAGQRAAIRAADRALPLLRPGRSLKFCVLPAGEDPDSLVRANGARAMRERLASAMPLVEMVWRIETEGRVLDTPERRAKLRADLRTRADTIADREVSAAYREHLFEKFDGAIRPSRVRGGRIHGGPGPRRPRPWIRDPDEARRYWAGLAFEGKGAQMGARMVRRALEAGALAAALNHPGLAEEDLELFVAFPLGEERLRTLRGAIADALVEHPGLDRESLRDHLLDLGLNLGMDSLFSAHVYDLAPFARPSIPLAEARAGWRVSLYRLLDPVAPSEGRRRERLRDAASVAENLTEETWERFRVRNDPVRSDRSDADDE